MLKWKNNDHQLLINHRFSSTSKTLLPREERRVQRRSHRRIQNSPFVCLQCFSFDFLCAYFSLLAAAAHIFLRFYYVFSRVVWIYVLCMCTLKLNSVSFLSRSIWKTYQFSHSSVLTVKPQINGKQISEKSKSEREKLFRLLCVI